MIDIRPYKACNLTSAVKKHIALKARAITAQGNALSKSLLTGVRAAMAARQQKAGKNLSAMDALIAAHALAHEFVLVSNDAVFRQVKGLKLEDWTKGRQRT